MLATLAMPRTRCPGCCKTFSNHTRLLQHMNQPHSHCMSHDLQISCATSILDIDADTDEDSDWMETGSSFSFHGNDITEEVAEEYITGESLDIAEETLPHQPVTKLYPGTSKNYGQGHTFMDIFNANQFLAMCEHNIFYPFASKTEWQFTLWLTNSGLSMATVDECLSLDIVGSFEGVSTHTIMANNISSGQISPSFIQNCKSALQTY